MNVPETLLVGMPSVLTHVVMPTNATNQTVVWAVVDAGTTNAVISGGSILATATGIVTVRATISAGVSASTAFTQDFNIEMLGSLSVEEIVNVPEFLPIGTYNMFRAEALPVNAGYRNIVWSVFDDGGTNATVVGNTLTTTAAGDVVLRATIVNGISAGNDFIYDFTIRIDIDPTVDVVATAGALPANALISDWYVHAIRQGSAGATGGNPFPGEWSWNYRTNFQVGDRLYGDRQQDAFLASYVPAFLEGAHWIQTPNDSRNLTVANANLATQSMFTVNEDMYVYVAFEMRTDISTVWWIDDTWEFMGPYLYMRNSEIRNDVNMFTGESLENEFGFYHFFRKHFEAGEVVRFGGINQGTSLGQAVIFLIPFSSDDFTPVTSITGVPNRVNTGTIELNATALPVTASNRNIIWSISYAGETGATIDGNTLTTPFEGTVVLTATILRGASLSVNYVQNFTITVGQPHVVLPPSPPFITAIAVSPQTTTVQQGQQQQFTATVLGMNSPPQGITWNVEGNTSAGTTISATGLLTVAANETATTITVTATSTFNSGISGTASVTVSATAVTPTPEPTPAPAATATPTPTATPMPSATPQPMLPPANFVDVNQNDWFADAVATVTSHGLFQGMGNNRFSPEENMTRAMFAQVLSNLAGVNLTRYANMPSQFTDVSANAWYAGAVAWAAYIGVVQGIGEGNFVPDTPITREQMAVMLYRFAQIMGVELPTSEVSAFADQASISYWAVDAVAAIQAAGIIIGRPDGSFDPQATATRAEVATVFARLLNLIEE